MIKVLATLSILTTIVIAGCSSGAASQVMAFDQVVAGTVETRKCVDALRVGLIVDTDQKRQAILAALELDIADLVAKGGKPEDIAVSAKHLRSVLENKLVDLDTQMARTNQVVDIAVSNLDYVADIARKAKDFEIYRASVGDQWKQYLQAVSLSRRVLGTSATTSTSTPTTQQQPVPITIVGGAP